MQDTQFYVEGYHVPIHAQPDVCVIGAGAAGVSAAVSAARCGLSVVLIEKYGYCGGATVAGLSGTICGLYSSGSQIEQIVFGFADEFHTRLKDRGGVDGPVKFGKTALVPHDGLIWKEVADGLLEHENIQVLYHSDFLKAFSDPFGTVTQLLIRGIGGQYVIEPTYVVDDVVHYCVANMPGAVARTSAAALNNATLPYVLELADKGVQVALKSNTHLLHGLNVHHGLVTNEFVGQAHKIDYVDALSALAA